MPEAAGTGNTAPVLTTLTVLLFLWALVAYFIRAWVKLRKSDGWNADDGAITGAVVVALAELITVTYAVHRGYGVPWDSISQPDRLPIATSLYASQILYVAGVGLTRLSTGFFTAHVLARDSRSSFMAWTLIGLCTVWTVASCIVIALRGNLSQPWLEYNGFWPMWKRWLAIEITGYVVDLVTAGVVTYFVHDLQMKTSKKLAVCAILNCRLILGIPIAFRLYYLWPHIALGHHEQADMITQVVLCTSIIFASITCLKPFLRPFDGAAFGSQASRTGLFRYTTEQDPARSQYYELSAARTATRSGTARKGEVVEKSRGTNVSVGSRSGEQEDELPLTKYGGGLLVVPVRPDAFTHVVQIKHSSHGEAEGMEEVGINKTRSWTVSVANV